MRGIPSAAAVTLLASMAFFAMGSNLIGYSIVQQEFISQLKLSLTDSGILVSAFYVTYSIMQIPGGYFADRWGGEKTITVFAAVAGVGAIGFSLADSFALALATRVVVGFGAGALLPASVRALTSRLQGHQLQVANGFFGAGWGIAQIFVLNLLPVLTDIYSWRVALMAVGIASLVVSVYAWSLAGGKRPVGPRVSLSSGRKPSDAITSRTILLVLINVTGIVVPVATLTWAPIQFEKLFGITSLEAARMVSVFGILTILASILGGIAAKAFGARRVMIASMAMTLAGTLLLTNPMNPTFGLVLMAVLGFASMFYISANFSVVPDSAPAGSSNPGFVFGVYNTISNALSFFPPLLTAFILDSTGSFPLLYASVSAVAVVGVVSSLLYRTTP